MRITKYPQSCLIVEGEGSAGRILIDPGSITMAAVDVKAFGRIDGVLVTHRHADHCDPRGIDPFRHAGVPVYANADVRDALGGELHVVGDGETFQVAGMTVVARDLPHVEMVDGSPGPPNTGFLIDSRLFHPGDGSSLPGLAVDALAVCIAGPSVSFRDAHRFIKDSGAQLAIPIHYDYYTADPALFATTCDIAKVVVLSSGDSTDV